MSNTESDVFRFGKNGPVYYLLAGRWFSATDFNGPWTFATTLLPEDFKHLPLEHPRSRMLVSVPGTEQAAEAVLLAQVPQTACVNKRELKAPEVGTIAIGCNGRVIGEMYDDKFGCRTNISYQTYGAVVMLESLWLLMLAMLVTL